MITLITGTPGAGKTLYTIAEELKKYSDRPLFVDGVPDLAITHLEFPDDLSKWPDWAPDGAVIVVDEAQRSWRPRAAGSTVPPAIAALETHRHKGIDIILITQHPNLIDQNVRRLVGRHVHVRRVFGWGRAILYEWDQATDPTRTRTAITRSWGYPKKAYQLYKSSSMHTARGQRVPFAFIFAVLAAVAVPVVSYFAYSRMSDRFTNEQVTAQSQPMATQPSATAPGVSPSAGAVSAVWNEENFIPVHPHYPESASAYAALRTVVNMPTITGCVASKSKCACYSSQATVLPVDDFECRKLAVESRFDPYRVAPPPVESRPGRKPDIDKMEKNVPIEVQPASVEEFDAV